jgi:hypothetical protein
MGIYSETREMIIVVVRQQQVALSLKNSIRTLYKLFVASSIRLNVSNITRLFVLELIAMEKY